MGELERWTDFNVAMTGATAALAGLVIVASSVNIAEIVKARSLTSRLAAAIAALVLALGGSAVGLIPEIPLVAYGIVVIVFALVASVLAVDAARQVYANPDPANRAKSGKAVVAFCTPAIYLAGGVALILGAPVGLVLLAAGSIVAIASALLVSWIVLVEVLR